MPKHLHHRKQLPKCSVPVSMSNLCQIWKLLQRESERRLFSIAFWRNQNEAKVWKPCSYAFLLQGRHLIQLDRIQRRNDERETVSGVVELSEQTSGELKGQTFTVPCRKRCQNVFTIVNNFQNALFLFQSQILVKFENFFIRKASIFNCFLKKPERG